MSNRSFIPLYISVLTVSDTRTKENDSSGRVLSEQLVQDGHILKEKVICKDDIYQIRKEVSAWIADKEVAAVLITGGTGLFPKDLTPEAVSVLFDKEIPGFGELFRSVSYKEIGTSTIQSRVLAGIANNTIIFSLPGSPNACRTAWNIIREQLDATKKQCSFINVLEKGNEQ